VAKLLDEPITATDLEEYVREQDSFDLELFVYRTAKALGLQASHGGSYEDPSTQKVRQYDVRVAAEHAACRIDLAIECKSLRRSYPLLLSRVPRDLGESFHHLIAAHKPTPRRDSWDVPAFAETAEVMPVDGTTSIYRPGEMVAKATAQVGRSSGGELKADDSEVFAKWSQALASADELVGRAMSAHESRRVDAFTTFVMPILVLSNDTLWAVDYSEDGSIKQPPHHVEEATLFVGRQYHSSFSPSVTISHLHVCTRNRIRVLLDAVVPPEGALWRSVFPVAGG
jgi:hypothetical protein